MSGSREGKALAGVPVFSACSPRELALICRRADVVRVPAGTRLIDQGELGGQFLVILEGRARVVRDGRAPSITVIGPGDHFGEVTLLDGGASDSCVVALTDMEIVVVAQREFFSMLSEVPRLARELLNSMARRLREGDAAMDEPLVALG